MGDEFVPVKHIVLPPLVPDDPAERLRRVWAAITVFGLLLVTMFVILGFVYQVVGAVGNQATDLQTQVSDLKVQVSDLKAQTLTNREVGYQNRAIACQTLAAVGDQVPAACLTPEVRAYWDPA